LYLDSCFSLTFCVFCSMFLYLSSLLLLLLSIPLMSMPTESKISYCPFFLLFHLIPSYSYTLRFILECGSCGTLISSECSRVKIVNLEVCLSTLQTQQCLFDRSGKESSFIVFFVLHPYPPSLPIHTRTPPSQISPLTSGIPHQL
jgi:hypothetical protein